MIAFSSLYVAGGCV